MTRPIDTRIADWLVEKVHLGLASDDERATVLADPDAHARLLALPAEDLTFREKFPLDEEIRRIESKYRIAAAADERSNRAALTSALLGPLLAAGLALVLVGLPPSGGSGDLNPDGTTSIKGNLPKSKQPKLKLYRQRSSGIDTVNSGVVTREGDVLQLGLVRGEATHGVVVSIDGRGATTLHFPVDTRGSTALGAGEQRLPSGYELDDAPEFERFFFVTTHAPADVSTVVHAAEALATQGQSREGSLSLPREYSQTSVMVRKESK